MRITADTNIVARLLTMDDPVQSPLAAEALDAAETVVLTVPMLCELVWVLRRTYRMSTGDTAHALRGLMTRENAVFDAAVVEAGLRVLEAGGDFADGAIAFEGRRAGAQTFISFDKQAVDILGAQGEPARRPG